MNRALIAKIASSSSWLRRVLFKVISPEGNPRADPHTIPEQPVRGILPVVDYED